MKKVVSFILSFAVVGSCVAADFSDVVNTDYTDAVDYLVNNNVIEGYPDGTFRPFYTVNRAEFTKIVVASVYHVADIDDCDTSIVLDSFNDTLSDSWYLPYVCVAVRDGIVSGYPDGTFGPSKDITFAEASKIIANVLVENTEAGSDVWYRPYVEKLGTKSAIPKTIVGFSHNVKRGEMVEMIYRLLEDIQTKPSLDYVSLGGFANVQDSPAAVVPDSLDSPAALISDTTDETCDTEKVCDVPDILNNVADVLMYGTTTDMLGLLLEGTTITGPEHEQILNTLAETMLNYVNMERADAGVDPLTLNNLLTASAQGHVQDMWEYDFFDHTGSDGTTSFERIVMTGYVDGATSYATGENIALGQTSVMDAMDTWMDSEGHRENILSENFEEFGLGVACGATVHDCYWVQNFGRAE